MHICAKFHQNQCSGSRNDGANVLNKERLLKIVYIGHSDLICTNKKLGPLGTLQTKYEWFLVSGSTEDFLRIGQKLHKITHNSMKNKQSTPILTNSVGVHP